MQVASSNGSLGLFGVGRRFGEKMDGTGSDLSIVAVFHDSERANNNFGINAQQSIASGLKATDLSSGFRSIGVSALRASIRSNLRPSGAIVMRSPLLVLHRGTSQR